MKTSSKLLGMIAASATILAACSKSETPPTAGDVKKAADQTATGMSGAVKPAVDAAKTAAQGTAAEMQAMAEAAKTQPLIDKAKSLLTEKKYQDALASLNELGKLKLTPEQEKVFTGLKDQLAKAMAGTVPAVPANAAGNLPAR